MSGYKLEKRKGSPYWYVDFGEVNGKRVRPSTRTTNKKQAEEFAKRRADQLWRQEKLGEAQAITWDNVVVAWIDEKSNENRGQSLENDKQRLRALSDHLRGRDISSISPAQIKQIVSALLPVAENSTRNRYLTTGVSILNFAADNEWRSPPARSKRFKECEPDIRWGTPEEMAALIAELPDYLAAPAEFNLATGPRMDNVRVLQWSQIDLRRRHAWLHGKDTKSGKSLAVPLNNAAMAVLERQRGKHWQWVFPYQERPLHDLNCTAFKNAVKRLGLHGFNWHSFRHTWATWHIKSGTGMYELMKLGGWSKVEMVLRYAHFADELAGKSAANIERFWHTSGSVATTLTTPESPKPAWILERETRLELATPTLAKIESERRWYSTSSHKIIDLRDKDAEIKRFRSAKNRQISPGTAETLAQKSAHKKEINGK